MLTVAPRFPGPAARPAVVCRPWSEASPRQPSPQVLAQATDHHTLPTIRSPDMLGQTLTWLLSQRRCWRRNDSPANTSSARRSSGSHARRERALVYRSPRSNVDNADAGLSTANQCSSRGVSILSQTEANLTSRLSAELRAGHQAEDDEPLAHPGPPDAARAAMQARMRGEHARRAAREPVTRRSHGFPLKSGLVYEVDAPPVSHVQAV
jgi:hypothetical protein